MWTFIGEEWQEVQSLRGLAYRTESLARIEISTRCMRRGEFREFAAELSSVGW